jgi:hypothetical protein
MTDTRVEPLFDRLARHAAIFEKVAERNLSSHYEEVQAQGKEAFVLAADLREAMEAVRGHTR